MLQYWFGTNAVYAHFLLSLFSFPAALIKYWSIPFHMFRLHRNCKSALTDNMIYNSVSVNSHEVENHCSPTTVNRRISAANFVLLITANLFVFQFNDFSIFAC